MLATRAMVVSVGPHKGWAWTRTWNRALVFSYKCPTTRSTVHFPLSFLLSPIYNRSANIRISHTLADGLTSQP